MADEEFVDPLIGAKLGPCRIEERLAAGGMGVVYRARHTLLDQDVAVKVLAPSLAADQEYVTRFFREAGAAGQIDHPNVIRVIDVGKFEERYYLVMEYVPGDTLDRVIDQERRLPLDRATKFIRDITSGLAAAHRAGIIHRDIKPGNIIVSPDGKPHLTDFGLARHAETKKGLTIEGTFLGTPEYASPEQVEGKKLDHRTDLYSLGVTYYQLLSGTLPFLGESPMEIAIKRTKEAPRPLENAFPGADSRSCGIVKKLLQPEPSHRYQSATDLMRDLDAILTGPKTPTGKHPAKTTQKSESFQTVVKTKQRIKMLIHWDLMTTAIVLAFVSGGLAARGGSFLGAWAASDSSSLVRMILLGVGTLCGAGALLMYRKEMATAARWTVAGILLAIMLLLSTTAGAWIDRPDGAGSAAATAALGALGAAMATPINLLALAIVALFAGAQVSFEREPGPARVVVSKILMAVGFVLAYAFARGGAGFDAPFRQLMVMPELSIPLATGAALACFFGAMMVTGYNFGARTKIIGMVVSLVGIVCLYTFAVLIPQTTRQERWTAILSEPFSGLAGAFRASGTLMAVVLILAVIEWGVVFAGIRRQDRSTRRRI
jgi:hypothetical protein